jgi:predicted ATPase
VTKWNLARVEVEGFKSIRQTSIDLHELNLMIGANGSGKSNLIAAFGMIKQVVAGRLQAHVAKKGGAAAFLHKGPKHTDAIRLKLDFGSNLYEAKLEFAQDDTFFFASEDCFFRGPGHLRPYSVHLGSGHKESQLRSSAAREPVARYVLEAMESWDVFHFHDTSDEAAVKRRSNVDDNSRLRPDASHLAAFLYALSDTHPDAYRRIVAAIRQVAPFFDDFRLKPDRIRNDEIQLEWVEKGSDEYFNAHALSDGTLRFICLATLLLQPRPPSLILIDEPELGLHPYAIHQLAGLFRSAATKAQLLVATQSVTLINQFEPDHIVVVDRIADRSSFRRINETEIEAWTDSYSLGELWEKAVLGGRPAQ